MFDLAADWCAALAAEGVAANRAAAAFERVAAAYTESHRHYHTLDHVAEVLAAVRRLREYADNFASVELAAWLHDLVYDARAKDNEDRSADRAGELLADLGIPAERIAAVQRLIRATKHLPGEPADADAAVLLDADLAILGADEPRYIVYARAIRREYHWVPERHYRDGRAKVLRGFLERERIYRTQLFFAERESAARRNLAWEIETLI